MTRKADREVRITQRLQQENRDLKQKVKSLRNSIRKLNKGFHRLEEEEKIEEKDIPLPAKTCYDCGVGEMVKTMILNRSWRSCNNCDRRTKVKILS